MTLPNLKPQPFYFKTAMVLVAIIALGYLCILGKEVLCPLLFGLLFSILLVAARGFSRNQTEVATQRCISIIGSTVARLHCGYIAARWHTNLQPV